MPVGAFVAPRAGEAGDGALLIEDHADEIAHGTHVDDGESGIEFGEGGAEFGFEFSGFAVGDKDGGVDEVGAGVHFLEEFLLILDVLRERGEEHWACGP